MRTDSLEVQVKAALEDYSNDVVAAANKAVEAVSKEAVRRLKDTSPKRTGKYARGWSRKVTRNDVNLREFTIYNASEGWKTHLLEHGHVTRNKYGYFGRTPAHVHIAPVEEWVVDETPKRFEEELNK